MLATQASLYLGEVCIRFPGTDHYDKVAELVRCSSLSACQRCAWR